MGRMLPNPPAPFPGWEGGVGLSLREAPGNARSASKAPPSTLGRGLGG